jgi:hypothetical protein
VVEDKLVIRRQVHVVQIREEIAKPWGLGILSRSLFVRVYFLMISSPGSETGEGCLSRVNRKEFVGLVGVDERPQTRRTHDHHGRGTVPAQPAAGLKDLEPCPVITGRLTEVQNHFVWLSQCHLYFALDAIRRYMINLATDIENERV